MNHFDFKDINLIPRKCIIDSRNECDTSIVLGKHTFVMPLIPANMECVINDEIAIKLARFGYFYIHHRFNTDEVAFAKKMIDFKLPVSISIGVNKDAYDILENLKKSDIIPDFITIDIAHGHSVKLEKMMKWINEFYTTEKPFVIAGNVSTPDAVRDLESWGVNAIKVGIGPGSACTTYTATGFGSRGAQASVIAECSKALTHSQTVLIADGGIKEPGDIAKSFALGAHMVMIGGMFSGLSDSPGDIVAGTDGRMYKEFWGSASVHQSGKKNRIEGTKHLVLMKSHGILDEMNYLKECLQSAISYGGGNNLKCFKDVKWF